MSDAKHQVELEPCPYTDHGYKKYLIWLPLAAVLFLSVVTWADSQNAIRGNDKAIKSQQELLEQHRQRLLQGEVQRAVIQQQIKTINDNVKETKDNVKEILREIRSDE